jgi:hypothetical protein
MTDTPDHQSLFHVELIVLARLSCASGANEEELAAAVTEVAPPDEGPSAREHVARASAALRKRSLVTDPKSTRKTPHPRSKLTDEGRRVLRTAFGLDKTPSWTKVRDRYVPALGLGLSAASEQASKLGNTEELTLAALRQHFEISAASTVSALCDALIAKALGLPPGPVTLLRLRAHVLTHELGLDPKVSSTNELEALATRAAIRSQGQTADGKRSLRQVLGRRWAYRVTASTKTKLLDHTTSALHDAHTNTAKIVEEYAAGTRDAVRGITSSARSFSEIESQLRRVRDVSDASQSPQGLRSVPAQGALPLPIHLQAASRVPVTTSHPSTSSVQVSSNPPEELHPERPPVVSADTLLTLVREAIPRIGSDGRFGDEKVFVSAIWHHIERDGRLPDLSLERFKRWLVTFNRDQLLDLARADTLGDMDDRLVEESEIRDLGATFHFVVDRQVAASGRGFHAR